MHGELKSPWGYIQWALALKEDSPLAETAKAVCGLRKIEPYSRGPEGMYAWKAVAMEALLLAAIARNAP